ncbi:MAG: hypothetical protein QM692_10590 [Thermomicrobiales bacterium]
MDRIDDTAGWTAEGLGIAIRMQGGDLAPQSRKPYILRIAGVVLGVVGLLAALSVAGWLAWRTLARRNAVASPDAPAPETDG